MATPKPALDVERPSWIFRGFVALGLLVNLLFLIINARPDKPDIFPRGHARLLMACDEARLKWIRENEIEEFETERNVDVELVTATSSPQVLAILRQEKTTPTGLDLAVIDDSIAGAVIEEGLARPLEDFVPRAKLEAALAEYLKRAGERCKAPDGRIWFFPKRATEDIAVYLRPAVEDAYVNWEQDRKEIDAALAEANGRGLPTGWKLKRSPGQWDSYDVFVAAWYWAHHSAKWVAPPNTSPGAPRLALRSGPGEDAARDLLSLFYRHGLKDGDLGRADSPAVADALEWLAVLKRNGLVVTASASADGMSADEVDALVRAREVGLATTDQERSFALHGGSRRAAPPGIDRPGDLAWAPLPAGASLELDASGKPARKGKSFSFTMGRSFAVPVHAPQPELGYRIARFLMTPGHQQRETEALGLLPVRRDIRQEYPILFRMAWMQNILDASYEQIERGTRERPHGSFDELYRRAEVAVLERPDGAPVSLEAVKAAIAEAAHGK